VCAGRLSLLLHMSTYPTLPTSTLSSPLICFQQAFGALPYNHQHPYPRPHPSHATNPQRRLIITHHDSNSLHSSFASHPLPNQLRDLLLDQELILVRYNENYSHDDSRPMGELEINSKTVHYKSTNSDTQVHHLYISQIPTIYSSNLFGVTFMIITIHDLYYYLSSLTPSTKFRIINTQPLFSSTLLKPLPRVLHHRPLTSASTLNIKYSCLLHSWGSVRNDWRW
jgi:hypothetical protein